MFSAANIDYATNPNITIFIVYVRTDTSASNQCLFGQDNGTFDRFFCPYHSGAGSSIISSGTSTETSAKLEETNKTIIASYSSKDGVTDGASVLVNGANKLTFTESHSNSGEDFLTIGAIGDYADASELFFGGYIGEIILYSRALKEEELLSINKYLGKKWGVKIP